MRPSVAGYLKGQIIPFGSLSVLQSQNKTSIQTQKPYFFMQDKLQSGECNVNATRNPYADKMVFFSFSIFILNDSQSLSGRIRIFIVSRK